MIIFLSINECPYIQNSCNVVKFTTSRVLTFICYDKWEFFCSKSRIKILKPIRSMTLLQNHQFIYQMLFLFSQMCTDHLILSLKRLFHQRVEHPIYLFKYRPRTYYCHSFNCSSNKKEREIMAIHNLLYFSSNSLISISNLLKILWL